MKAIAFYISSHGFGHLTRCLAIIEELLKRTNYYIYIACNKQQNDFAKIYLRKYKERLKFSNVVTDIGLVNKSNSLNIDKDRLQSEIYKFVNSLDDNSNKELAKLQNLNVELIVTDISILGIVVGKKLGVKIIGISNFTWYQQYKYLGLDLYIINLFRNYYNEMDLFLEYDISIYDSDLKVRKKKISLLSRKFDNNKIQSIKHKLEKPIFISYGRSAEIDNINVRNYSGTIICTQGTNIISTSSKIYKLPLNVLDTQNYIAASECVIAKAGWGIVAEAVLAQVPLVLIERNDVLEDTNTILLLERRKLAATITEDELKNLNYDVINDKLSTIDITKYRYMNSISEIITIIKEWVGVEYD